MSYFVLETLRVLHAETLAESQRAAQRLRDARAVEAQADAYDCRMRVRSDYLARLIETYKPADQEPGGPYRADPRD